MKAFSSINLSSFFISYNIQIFRAFFPRHCHTRLSKAVQFLTYMYIFYEFTSYIILLSSIVHTSTKFEFYDVLLQLRPEMHLASKLHSNATLPKMCSSAMHDGGGGGGSKSYPYPRNSLAYIFIIFGRIMQTLNTCAIQRPV